MHSVEENGLPFRILIPKQKKINFIAALKKCIISKCYFLGKDHSTERPSRGSPLMDTVINGSNPAALASSVLEQGT